MRIRAQVLLLLLMLLLLLCFASQLSSPSHPLLLVPLSRQDHTISALLSRQLSNHSGQAGSEIPPASLPFPLPLFAPPLPPAHMCLHICQRESGYVPTASLCQHSVHVWLLLLLLLILLPPILFLITLPMLLLLLVSFPCVVMHLAWHWQHELLANIRRLLQRMLVQLLSLPILLLLLLLLLL